jgi:hypothetical protein
MSTNDRQTDDTITAALDALANEAATAVALVIKEHQSHGGTLDIDELCKVGSFLLAYRRDRDEREARRANVRGTAVGE